jgi:predicted transcriptional regulator
MVAEETKVADTQTKPVAEKQTNCLACGKPIKKLKRYYRNGKFYCNKKCWRKYLDKSKEEQKEKK